MHRGEVWLINLDPTIADAFQIRSLSQKRFVRRLGQLPLEKVEEISQALAIVLSI